MRWGAGPAAPEPRESPLERPGPSSASTTPARGTPRLRSACWKPSWSLLHPERPLGEWDGGVWTGTLHTVSETPLNTPGEGGKALRGPTPPPARKRRGWDSSRGLLRPQPLPCLSAARSPPLETQRSAQHHSRGWGGRCRVPGARACAGHGESNPLLYRRGGSGCTGSRRAPVPTAANVSPVRPLP